MPVVNKTQLTKGAAFLLGSPVSEAETAKRRPSPAVDTPAADLSAAEPPAADPVAVDGTAVDGPPVEEPAVDVAVREEEPPADAVSSAPYQEVPYALPDYAAPPGLLLTTAVDESGTQWHLQDDPSLDPLVSPQYDAQDRNWVRYRSSWGGSLRFVAVILLIVVLVIGVRGRIYNWIDNHINPSTAAGEPLLFTIRSGESVNEIATNLNNANVISNATVFRYWLRCDGPTGGEITISGFLLCDTDSSFDAGEYALNQNMSYADLNRVLLSGPIPEEIERFVIPEGLRVAELVERMLVVNPQFEREGIIAALNNPAYKSNYLPEDIEQFMWYEGLLFPATYDVAEGDLRDEAKFIQRMSNTFDSRYSTLIDRVGRDPVIDALALTDYEIITIASLIEEEARVAVDRPQMARVIYNRLLQGEPLGVDASVYYGLNKSFKDTLTASDLMVDSPYNTRLNTGIPPTPIAAPGLAALRAALQPDPNPDLLFWVRTDHNGIDGAHTFTTNLTDHNEAVAICRDLGYCS